MRRLASLVLLGMSVFTGVGAAADANNHATQVALYAKQHASKPERYLSMQSQLVPIIQRGDWVKVGVRPQGDVAWINMKQYRQALVQNMQPDVQTISISVQQQHGGKPKVNIVAYHNGKAMSDQQARKIYDQLQVQQRKQMHDMQLMNQDLLRQVNDDFAMFGVFR